MKNASGWSGVDPFRCCKSGWLRRAGGNWFQIFHPAGFVGLDDTHDAHVEKTADMGGLIHAHENVERVAVLAECGGMKPKSKGNTMPSGSRPPDLNRFDSGS